ncbi:N-acetylmuramoyl-L-alanine amidase [Clostridium intestinale]|uniref:N-acetylmuramoyl-L-alanine amidase n=1 Tax=Clostridium intestinale DSM 6191 TaxID=1121320 RepID=A0A1M5THS1_9CLOT|nr:N-acetylmuramoyl-L-alanine amidase [Clostridium intestinale]SHH50365.1 N-acetylmuramoyl-L-alanine amidase [Clostridium intestinale DSM 6191]
MKIAISIGHTLTGKGTGAVGFLNESICTREIGERVKSMLEAQGHEVTYCRVDLSDNDLAYRVELANKSDADIFAEIHLNAGGGLGIEVYTYGAKEVPQARAVLNAIVELGFMNRGIKDGKSLYVIRKTNMTAMLIECCFVDTKEDADRYNPDAIAKAIVKGLIGTAVKEIPPVAQDTEPGKEISKCSGDTYIIEIQQEFNKQFNSGLSVDGIPGPKTLAASPLVKEGAQGNITRWIQSKVGTHVDGVFGPITKQAVKNYQNHTGLYVDGVVGQNTWRKLLGL